MRTSICGACLDHILMVLPSDQSNVGGYQKNEGFTGGKTPAPQHTYVISQYFLYYKINYNNLLLIYFTVSAQNATQLSKALAVVASCDEHTNLSQVMSKLAQVEENLQQITEEQGDSDFFTFSELLKDYLGQLSAVKVRYNLYMHLVTK